MNVNQALSSILRDGVDIHRCAAAQALGAIGNTASVDILIEALLDEDEDVRTDAAEALSVINDAKAAPKLLENLIGDPCFEVKIAAVQALSKMQFQEVVPWLKRLLVRHDEEINWDEEEFYQDGWDSWVDLQVEAIKSLAALSVEEAVPDIMAAIDDDEGQDLTEMAFESLGRLGDAGIGALIHYLNDPESRRRRRAVFILAGLPDEKAQKAVQVAVMDSAKEVRISVIKALAKNKSGEETMAMFFRDPDVEVRALAVAAAGVGATEQLVGLLDDPSPEVQAITIKKLKEFSEVLSQEGMAERLADKLQNGEPAVSAQAAEALALGFGVQSQDLLITVLQDPEIIEETRLGALRGLSKIVDFASLEAMAAILGDDTRQLRLEALSQMAKIAASEQECADAAENFLIAAFNGELVEIPEGGPEQEMPEVIHDTAELEQPVDAEELTSDSDPGENSLEALGPESKEDYPTSTWAAIMGEQGPQDGRVAELGNIKENRVRLTQSDMELLALSARTPKKGRVNLSREIPAYSDVPQFAARVMGDIASEKTASALAAQIESKNEQLRSAALDSLARIGKKMGRLPKDAVQGLIRVVANADRDNRLLAVRALGNSDATECAGFLQNRLVDGDSFVKTEAIQALSRLGAEIDSLDELLESQERSVRLAAAEAHANVNNRDSVDKLLDFAFANGGYHRRDAGRFLRKVNVEAANDRLVAVLQDEERRREWPVAIEALAEINMNMT